MNHLLVDKLLSRLGDKQSDSTWPILPGIVPVMLVSEARELVSRPKRARAITGLSNNVPAGNRWEFGLATRRDVRVDRILLSSADPTTQWGFGRRNNVPAIGAGINYPVDDLPVQGEMYVVGPSAFASVPIWTGGNCVLADLGWHFGPNETPYITTEALLANTVIAVAFEWVEEPNPAITP